MTIKDIAERMESGPYLRVNRDMAQELGYETAIVYAELKRRSDDNGGKEFVCSVPDLAFECSIATTQQQKILHKLEKRGYIQVSYKGMPKYRHITVLE